MLKLVTLLACAILVLTGCTTAGKRTTPPATSTVVQVPVIVPTPSNPPPQIALPALRTNPPPQIALPAFRTNEFTETWVLLNRWIRVRGFSPPHRLAFGAQPVFIVHTSKSLLILQADSQIAYWDEVELHLGFAPQLIGGQLFIHRLDLLKNLEPLLSEPTAGARLNRVIVIDPGHGGSNPGASSVVDGRLEKQFTLDWALRLAPLLATNGWQVFLTRTNDVDVSLADRVAFAEQHKADLFVSLHFNSFAPEQKEAGLETFCLTPAGMPSTLTRDYADYVAQVFPNNAHDVENWAYAVKLHRALLRTNLLADRGVRHARFMGVLRGQNRPALLIEGGYLSNPAEARRIAAPAFRQKLAEAMAAALK
jgi:N-acetylmuramoyl-L-alanine amidase